MYCHLDFYEVRQHRFFSSRVSNVLFRLLLRNAPIVIPQSLRNISYRWDDSALGGKRTYHTQHFFCAECGDPFLSASGGELARLTRHLAVTD